jgi:carboxypeptidase Taq
MEKSRKLTFNDDSNPLDAMAMEALRSLAALIDHFHETARWAGTLALLEWDERTGMPSGGAEQRAQQISDLSVLIHRRRVDRCVIDWLDELQEAESRGSLRDAIPAGSLSRIREDHEKAVRLPESLVGALAKATTMGQRSWGEAKERKDCTSFLPVLAEIVELKKEEADLRRVEGMSRYGALLDLFEEGADAEQLGKLFYRLQSYWSGKIDHLAEATKERPRRWSTVEVGIERQRALNHWIANHIGFDFQRGRLDETSHPFCTTLGPHDHRILTRYDRNDWTSGFYSTLHEAGHGIYEQGLATRWHGLPAGSATSLGIHESLSRFWENVIGRSEGFWRGVFPEMRDWLPPEFQSANPGDLALEVNRVEPSCIRVEADETTYNLHIALRMELESKLIEGSLRVEDLPAAWNEAYARYLGVTPAHDGEGVLQDIHWSAGLFGYFPTYALGNLIAAQWLEAMESSLGPMEKILEKQEFGLLVEWFRNHVFPKGRCLTSSQLVEEVTGKPIQPFAWNGYLEKKWAEPLKSFRG